MLSLAIYAKPHALELQDKLLADECCKDFGSITVAEATNIADMALEHTVRSILSAVQATEVLESSQGATCPICQLCPLPTSDKHSFFTELPRRVNGVAQQSAGRT